MADQPIGNGSDSLVGALSNFRNNLQTLQVQRTIQGANQAVQQVRNSELKDDEKMNQLRGIGEQLTYSLAGQGVPATTLEALTQYIPKQTVPGSAEQAVILGTPEQRDRGQKLIDDRSQRQIDLLNAKYEGMKDLASSKVEAQAAAGNPADSKEFLNVAKFLQPDQSARNAFGVSALTIQNAEKLTALVGNDRSDAALNKIPPQFVAEAAQGLARLVKGGVASEGEVSQFLPKNVARDEASLKNYFTANPGGAGQASMIRLYLKAADREHAVASQQIEDSVLQRAKGVVKTLIKDPEAAKQHIASLIPGTNPNDVIIDTATRTVTTKQKMLRDQKMGEYVPQIRDLVGKAKSGNPSVSGPAKQQLNTLGIDPTHPMKQIETDIFSKIKSGEW